MKSVFMRGLRIALVSAAALILIVVVAAWLALRASLPRIDGEANLAGLSAPASIERDATGVPVIRGATREDALRKLREKIRARLKNGSEVVGLEIGPSTHPWMEFAGIFKDDPWIGDWVQSMAEYRQKVEDDPNR